MHRVQLNCDQALVSKIMSQITTKTAGYRSVMDWIPGLCKALLTFSPLSCSNIFVCVLLLLSLKTNSWCSVSRCARPALIVNAVSGCLCYFCLGGEKDTQRVSAVVMRICVSDWGRGGMLSLSYVRKRFPPLYQDMTTRSWLCVCFDYMVFVFQLQKIGTEMASRQEPWQQGWSRAKIQRAVRGVWSSLRRWDFRTRSWCISSALFEMSCIEAITVSDVKLVLLRNCDILLLLYKYEGRDMFKKCCYHQRDTFLEKNTIILCLTLRARTAVSYLHYFLVIIDLIFFFW